MSRPSSPSVNRPSAPSRPSASRPSAGTRPSTPSRPSTGTRPSTPSRPSAGQPSTRPSTPSRPSAGQRPATRPGGGAATRPSTPSAGTRPSIDRGKIQSGIGAGAGQKPSMPDWFKPGASQLPSTRPAPPAASQLPARPGSGEGAGRPGAGGPGRPEGPGARPPGAKPPVATQPIAPRPPVARPPIAGSPREPEDLRGTVRRSPVDRPEHVPRESGPQCVLPRFVLPWAIRLDRGIPGIQVTRVIVPVTGGDGQPPAPLPVGSSIAGPIRSTTDTDREARSTTRIMWST